MPDVRAVYDQILAANEGKVPEVLLLPEYNAHAVWADEASWIIANFHGIPVMIDCAGGWEHKVTAQELAALIAAGVEVRWIRIAELVSYYEEWLHMPFPDEYVVGLLQFCKTNGIKVDFCEWKIAAFDKVVQVTAGYDEQGTREDWLKLAPFHYRGHNIAPARKIFRMTRGNELCGVIVYSYPPPACYGRGLVLPRMTMQQLNQQLSIINRIVIHPKYRTIGLGEKLIRDTLPQVGTLYVEMVAVMAKYSPFAERAGMRKVAQQQSLANVKRQMQVLDSLGFDLQLIGSQHYVDGKLESLNEQQVTEIETAFLASSHPRIKKEVTASHDPFGRRTATYTKDVRIADNHKLAKLIKILAMLSQTKVYLFWKKHTLV